MLALPSFHSQRCQLCLRIRVYRNYADSGIIMDIIGKSQ